MKNLFAASVITALTIWALVSVAVAQSSATPKSDNSGSGLPQGTPLVVELSKSIDAKKAKPGDKVQASLMQDVIAHGELAVRRGSKIEGHVTEAKEYSKEAPESVLGVVFDKVFLKGGGEMSVNAVLQAVAPPVEDPNAMSVSVYGGDASGGSQPVSSGRMRPLVDPRARVDHTRDDALRNAADPKTYGTADTLHGGLLSGGNRGAFGMPGVSLKSSQGSSHPMMVSNKSSIKLENGTQMVLTVTVDRHP